MPNQEQAATPGTALAIPDDIRNDLLNAQRGAIGDRQKLPQVKIMAAGVGLYEFADTHETTREFVGVILGSHARNVTWDIPYGAPRAETDPKGPACGSNDGTYGIPRVGFTHAALGGRPAVGTERIRCSTCPYNQWGSKGLIPALLRAGETAASAKGKACTNQVAAYLLVAGRETPVELILPPTSIVALDEYLANLLNHNVPVQAVLTVIGQEVKTRGGLRWGQATFRNQESLGQMAFDKVLAARAQWSRHITGTPDAFVEDAEVEFEPVAGAAGADDGDMPF